MPNTLAHIGVQAVTTRTIIKNADLKWIYIGCIIPDLPWIVKRVVESSFISVDAYDFRLYAMIQASLFFCLILSTFFASFAKDFWKVFAILSLNSLLHLLLDATQIKWGNGVHFFAPYHWYLSNFGFYWPESLMTYSLTAFGLLYIVFNWKKSIKTDCQLTFRPLSLALLSAYLILPFAFISGPEMLDNHYVNTLRSKELRQGKYIELDRVGHNVDRIKTYSGEEIYVDEVQHDQPSSISLQGTFVTNNRIMVINQHLHWTLFRNSASYLGLSLVSISWIYFLIKKYIPLMEDEWKKD